MTFGDLVRPDAQNVGTSPHVPTSRAAGAAMTPDQAQVLAVLRAVLPPILDAPIDLPADMLVAVDLEWHRETGDLELIGVGNADIVIQLRYPFPVAVTDAWIDWFRALVGSRTTVYQNWDADMRKLREYMIADIAHHRHVEDTMQAHAVLHCEKDHDLGSLVGTYGSLPPSYKDLRDVAPREYNAADVVSTVAVWRGLEVELGLDPEAAAVYRTQNLALLREVVIRANETPRLLDAARVLRLKTHADERKATAQGIAEAYCGYPMLLSSPKQVQNWLYAVERFPVQWNKDRQDPSPTADKDALAALRAQHGNFDQEWEQANELTTTYVADRLALHDAHPFLEAKALYNAGFRVGKYADACCDGGVPRASVTPRISLHTQTSGRHSMTQPPVTQWKGEVLRMIRPRPRHAWVGFDMNQVELRIDAVLTGDEPSILAFANGWDIHTMNCCDVFGYEQPLDLVDPHSSALAARWRTVYQWRGKDDLRRTFAKRFVYRLDYGGKPEYAGDIPGARELGLDAAALVEGADTYLERHPAKRAWRARKDTELEQTRIARTFMGRPRRLTDPNPGRRYRAGINHEHQGATTDINNTWILAIARALPWARYQYGAFDSQTWEVPEDRVADAEAAIRAIVDGSCWDVGGRELRVPVDFKPARRSE